MVAVLTKILTTTTTSQRHPGNWVSNYSWNWTLV